MEFGEGKDVEELRLGFPYFAEGIEDPDGIDLFIATLDEHDRLAQLGIVDADVEKSIEIGIYIFEYLKRRKQGELDVEEKAAKKAIIDFQAEIDKEIFASFPDFPHEDKAATYPENFRVD